MSFTGLNLILLPLLAELIRLSSAHRDALNVALGLGEGRMPEPLLISNATLTLLSQAATKRPLLVMVDDLHWLDRSTAAVLGFVARRLAGSRIGFAAASRSGEATFFERSGLPEFVVQPLDDASATSLVSTRFPELASSVLARVLAEAEGNPLALLELPAALTASQRVARQKLPGAMPMSRRLQSVFASRIARLPQGARQLLLMMALDGTGDIRVLRAQSDRAAGLRDLGAAEKARLAYLDMDSRRVAFRHPLIRTTVVAGSTGVERVRANRALAELWADQPDRHAWHLAEATVVPDEKVAALLEQAAYRTLRRGDGVGAISALMRSAELSPRGIDRGRRLAEAAYIGADVTGDLHNANQLLADAHLADPEFKNSLQAAVTASIVLINGLGDVDTAHRLLVGAIENTPDTTDPAFEEALNTMTLVCFFGSRPEMWTPFYSALDRLAPRIPIALSLTSRTFADPVRTAAAALPELEAVIAELDAETDPTQIVRVAIATAYVDRIGRCRRALLRVVADGRAGGAVASAIQALILLGRDDILTGQWAEARELLAEAVGLCEAHGYELFAWPGRYHQSIITALSGDYDATKASIEAMLQWAEPRRVRAVAEYCCHANALVALSRGEFEEAYRQATSISPAGTLASHVPTATWAMLDVVEAAARTNRHYDAEAHVEAMREANIGAISPRLALQAEACAAIVARDDGALDLFKHAIAVPGADHWPFDLARVELLFGERLRRARANVESRSHLGKALETFERLGARPWADRARNELRATGPTKPRTRDQHIETLTPQEREIALLAASGLTNKQIGERLFLSHRTVGGHLHRVFPKLGVSTRAALRDALASRAAEARDTAISTP